MVKYWIENGADINSIDENGRNALHLGILFWKYFLDNFKIYCSKIQWINQ
jgi:ankyrin repeat protein